MGKSLLAELKKFRKDEKISMHIPGHKGGRGLGASFIKNAFDIDVTELDGTDNLQNPDGILNEAQERCAKIFGAGETCFLTGGSSLGLRAAILGSVPRGGKLLVDRTCHKSVISAVTLGGIEPIFVSPDFDKEKGLYLGVSAAEVARAVSENPDIYGAVITSPTYYGICSDISGIADVLHRSDKFLIVDEAHGAHFIFSRNLPETALCLGADVCVQSAHKTLPALGQCSVLHISKKTKAPASRIIRTLRMIQTTSPSYMLMTSIDEAAAYMNSTGRLRLNKLITAIKQLKAEVSEKTVLRFADTDTLIREQDATRIAVDFSQAEISGRHAECVLIEEFGIYPEMSDSRYVVLIPTVANSRSEIKRLTEALCQIGGRRFPEKTAEANLPLPNINMECIPYKATEAEFETLPVSVCEGRISAAVVSACPPGAAVLVPGQRIDRSAVEYITKNGIAAELDVVTG